MEKNLTTGSVFKTVIQFSLPYLLSYFLQTLYGMADLFIIGQFNGVDSTTAVSIGSQVMHMLTVMIVGLAMGTTVMIGRAIGANKQEQAARAIGNTITLFMVLSIFLTACLLLAVKAITAVMSTPAEAVSGTISYLTICFVGIPFITAYNIISSIFRGMGDSKSPMYFIAVACTANIALDYLFIGGCELGPAGAALGTTLSQTISVIVSLTVITKRKTGISLTKSDFKPRNSRRTVYLLDDLFHDLESYKAIQDSIARQYPGYNPDGYVFCQENGQPYEPRTYQDLFKRCVRQAGIPDANFHALRHTFATRSLEQGMDVVTLSRLLGHANPSITLDKYGHALDDHKKASIGKLGELYSGTRRTPPANTRSGAASRGWER